MITRRTTLAALPALLGAGASSTSSAQDGTSLETFEMDALINERAESGRPYLPFLNRDTLRCGLYVLAAGAEDGQNPHETDEVYYVLSGKANIRVDGEVRPVTTGTVIFVKAQAEHKFIDIEEEIRLLVFFD